MDNGFLCFVLAASAPRCRCAPLSPRVGPFCSGSLDSWGFSGQAALSTDAWCCCLSSILCVHTGILEDVVSCILFRSQSLEKSSGRSHSCSPCVLPFPSPAQCQQPTGTQNGSFGLGVPHGGPSRWPLGDAVPSLNET